MVMLPASLDGKGTIIGSWLAMPCQENGCVEWYCKTKAVTFTNTFTYEVALTAKLMLQGETEGLLTLHVEGDGFGSVHTNALMRLRPKLLIVPLDGFGLGAIFGGLQGM